MYYDFMNILTLFKNENKSKELKSFVYKAVTTISEGEALSKENSEELAKWLENLLGKQKVAGVKV